MTLEGPCADNLTLDIKKLQAKIIGMQQASFRLLSDTDTLHGLAEGLNSLSPQRHQRWSHLKH